MPKEEDIILSLLETPFSKRPKDEQTRILNAGRPMPPINIQQKEKTHIRSFHTSWYTHHKWLTASSKLQRLFCWPCLLLATERNKFSCYGYTDLKNLSRSIERHSSSKEHLTNILSYRQLLHQDIPRSILLNDIDRLEKEKHQVEVRINREIFKKIIDIACFVSEQDHVISAPQDSLEDPMDSNRFKSLLELILSYDEHLMERYKTTLYFSKMSKTVLFEIIQCVNEAIKASVGDSIKKTQFYSVIVDDASDITESMKCAVFLRLINEGVINEHFLGFHDMDRTPNTLASTIKTVLNKFDIQGKMISLSCDGGVLKVGTYSVFETIMREDASQAILTHCLAYKLTYIIQQVCSSIEGVKSFFATVQGIPAFFHSCPNRQQILNKHLLKRIPTCSEENWSAGSKFLDALLTERLALIETFQYIAASEESNARTIREAEAFRNKLDQTDTVFFLMVFRDIFTKIENLDAFLQKNQSKTHDCWQSVLYTISECDLMKCDAKYSEYINIVYCGKDFVKIENGLEEMDIDNDNKNNYFQMLELIKVNLLERFSNITKLKFMGLGDASKIAEENINNNQVASLSSLETTYGQHFNKERLRNELDTIYSPQHKDNFESGDFFQLISNMVKSEYHLILPEVYKMFCLLGTIPVHPTERKGLLLKKFRIYSTDKVSMQNFNALARLYYERDLLAILRKRSNFYEDIIDRFAKKKERKINLMYNK